MCSRDEAPESGCRQNVHFFIVLPNNDQGHRAGAGDVPNKNRLVRQLRWTAWGMPGTGVIVMGCKSPVRDWNLSGGSIPNDRHRKISTRRGELHPCDRRREGSLGLCSYRVVSIGDQPGQRLTPASQAPGPRADDPVASATKGCWPESQVDGGLP
jgi:hypothetical protein